MNETFEITINDNGIIEDIPLYNEPVGYDSVDFNLQQEKGRYGRDISFAGGEIELEFTPMAHPEVFDKLAEQFEKHGFEADVTLRIMVGSREFKGNLDFLTAKYNGYDSFKCMMLQESKSVLLKKRSDLPVDLFSDEDLDENASLPVSTENVFIQSVETHVRSVWGNDEPTTYYVTENDFPSFYPAMLINKSQEIRSNDIRNTLTNMYDSVGYIPGVTTIDEYKVPMLVNSTTDLRNVKVSIKTNGSYLRILGSSYGHAIFKIKVGSSFYADDAVEYEVSSASLYTNPPGGNNTLNVQLLDNEIVIPDVLNGQKIWGYVELFAMLGGVEFIYRDIEITVEARSADFDLITKGVTVYDAISKVVNDTCGLPVDFRLAQLGVLKNTYLFTGDMIRGIDNFKLSFDDIIDWFPELNLDYEITKQESVFIGRYEDFYTDNEIDVIEDVAFDTFGYSENELYAINKFTYEYEKYQSQKEDAENYTKNIIHGRAEYHVNNKQVGESKEVKVSWVRDPFMLKEIIRKAFTETEQTSTNEDNTVYIIDTTNMNGSDYNIRKSAMLYHEPREDLGQLLVLKNDGSFRFDLLGIHSGSMFTIHNTPNGGQEYTVTAVYPNYIELLGNSIGEEGEFFTEFTYSLIYSGIPVVTKKIRHILRRTEGIVSPTTFANYDFSVKHNIDRYWRTWVATCVKNGINPKLLKYDNNPEYKEFAWTMDFPPTQVVSHDEGGDINTSNITPILDTKVVETKLIMPFERYISISDALRSSQRGFIRTFDTKNRPIYVYPQSMTARYKASGLKEVDVKGELKNIPDEINIGRNRFGSVSVGFHVFNDLNYSVVGEDTILFKDMNNTPILKYYKYDKIQVNSISYKSIGELEDAFDKL